MILTTWFTLPKRMIHQQQSSCPYKLEPSCGVSSETHLGWLEKQSQEDLKQNTNVLGKRMKWISRKHWQIVMSIVLLVSLNACAGKVVLLKDGDMKLLDDGNYAGSAIWMEERLQFENDLVKRLSECNTNE